MKKENIMIALEIKITKNIMNALLLSEQFDSFLVEEAVITTYNTFHIDGHLVKDFYSSEEWAQLEHNHQSAVFSSWKDIRSFCFQLQRPSHSPIRMQVPAAVGVAASLIRSLVLNIRYDNGKVTCITGSAFTTFVMDKSAETLWDAYVRQLLSSFGLDFEERI